MKKRLHKASRVLPFSADQDVKGYGGTAKVSKDFCSRKAWEVITEAQSYWHAMETFRRDRERNKNYTFGRQWDDYICIDGQMVKEEDYIKNQGNMALKNNLIRRMVQAVLGVYRSQAKEPTCTARDRDEQKFGETMSIVLQANMQLNRMTEVYARSMEEFLISGFVVHRKWYGPRNNMIDCWTDYVQPNNFFIDNNMRDFRGWDVTCLGEVHDVSFEELCERFARGPRDIEILKRVYCIGIHGRESVMKNSIGRTYDDFGFPLGGYYDFLVPKDISRCRVIEVWRKEMKYRYRCHDVNTGELFKIEQDELEERVLKVNRERLEMAAGIPDMKEEDVPLIRYEWYADNFWKYYYLTPFGDIIEEGETPYEHEGHPYVFKAYPFIDGEIHSFVSNVIDQQRYVNRLVTMYDWIIRASAKGVLLFPEDCLPKGMTLNDVADEWARFNGVIMIKESKTGRLPQQVANNCTNIGIHELLNMQLKFFEDISGVNGALQGKPGYSGMSASLYNQQTQNATTTLLDLLDSFSAFVKEGAWKDVKNIQQFYDTPRRVNIAGKNATFVEYDPKKLSDIEFDLSIVESTATPAYRAISNDMLIQLWQAKAISVEQLLEHGDFPFADNLLQSIQAQKEQLENGQLPEGLSPELAAQAQQGADMQAVERAQAMLRA